ncbi:MAG: replication initiator protein A [Acetatifactor muris]|nr:replication initiator protein A [Acetatifactor muris]
MPLELDYYYGNEAEQYSFYRIPKVLFTDSRFKAVSVEAKVLYGLLLDRMALSVKNGWMDEYGRVYIIYTISDILETLGCAEQKANKLLGELDSAKGIGLIERKRRGLGKPNIIYVKNFIARKQEPSFENHNSRFVKITNQEMRKSQTNNTDLSDTDLNETDPSIYPADSVSHAGGAENRSDRMDGTDKAHSSHFKLFNAYREILRENIDYDILVERSPHDRERLDGFVELMAEVCCSRRETVRINQEDMGVEVVKERFLKLHSGHIEYVMDCLDRNTTLVGNIKAYTLSVLFNAPATMSQYYASLVSHDMASGKFCGG